MVQLIFSAFLIYLIYKTYMQSKTNKRMSGILKAIRAINDETTFFQLADEGIQTSAGKSIRAKYQVLKLWGLATHNRLEEYDQQLTSFNLSALKEQPLMASDDSLFYLTLAIPNILQTRNEYKRIENTLNKVKEEVSDSEKRLDYQLGLACVKYYKKEDDCGIKLMEDIYEGTNTSFTYNKAFISMYKQIIACNLAKHYTETNQSLEEVATMVEGFENTHIGQTWLKNIDYRQNPTPIEEETQSPEAPSVETNDVIDVTVDEHIQPVSGDNFEEDNPEVRQ